MKIYKLCYIEDLRARETFNQTEIHTAKSLKTRLQQAIDEGQVCEETLIELDYPVDLRCDNLSLDQVIEIFRSDGYTLEEDYLECPEIDELISTCHNIDGCCFEILQNDPDPLNTIELVNSIDHYSSEIQDTLDTIRTEYK